MNKRIALTAARLVGAVVIGGAVVAVVIPQAAVAATNVTISDSATTDGSFTGGVFTPSVADPATSNVGTADVETALNSGTNVTVTTNSGDAGAGGITLIAPVDAATSAAAGTVLSLDAANDVDLDAGLTLGGSLVVNPDQVSQAGQSGTGAINVLYAAGDGSFVPCSPACITTAGDQTYNGALVLGEDAVLTTSASLSAQAINLGSYTLTVANGGGSTISGPIIGSGGLIKESAGTLTLSAASTYSGPTTVASGALDVIGTVGGAVSLASGATLEGDGTIDGNVTQQAGGIVAPGPGTGTGTLGVGGDYTWNGSTGATADFQLSDTGSGSDQLAITGALAEGQGSNFEFDFDGTGEPGTTYTLASFASTTFGASDFSYTDLGTGLTGTFSIVNGDMLQFTTAERDTVSLAQPSNITVDATSPAGATVTYSTPAATDSAGLATPTVSCQPKSGTVFPIGTETVTCTATDPDASNSPQQVSFSVTVEGAAAQLNDLATAVQGISSGKLLAPIVKAAESQLAAGHPALASLAITEFIITVKLLGAVHVLPAATARALTADAAQILTVIGR